MGRAFKLFPALKSIKLRHSTAYASPLIGSKELIGAFDAFLAEDLLTKVGLHTVPALFTGLAAPGIKITELLIGDPSFSSESIKQVGATVAGFSTSYHHLYWQGAN